MSADEIEEKKMEKMKRLGGVLDWIIMATILLVRIGSQKNEKRIFFIYTVNPGSEAHMTDKLTRNKRNWLMSLVPF